MGNSWKAKCVKSDCGWNVGEFIKVVNGKIVDCSDKCIINTSTDFTKTFETWCEWSKTKWELITDETIEEVTDILGNTLSRVISDSDETSSDNINPNHYKSQCSLECIEAMLMSFGGTVVYDFCICNAWKYMWRYQNKNGKEDLTKARWYLEMAEKVDCDRTEHWNIETVLNELEEKMK